MRARLFCFLLLLVATDVVALKPEVVHSSAAIPPHVAGRFREPTGFQQSASGQYFVFDRRSHAVFGVDEAQTSSWEIVKIGAEAGRIIEPTAFSVAPDGTFAVADAPGGAERIQVFTPVGFPIGGFFLPGRARSRITIDNFVLNGISTLQYTGSSILMSQPDAGGLITEYHLRGTAIRTFGSLRPTGHEEDREVHLALNSGLPLVDPTGGYFFVFQAGLPVFRKYDASGQFMFERHIEGIEIDGFIKALPARWPRRRTAEGELPLVRPTVRTAAVDRDGRLWISLAVPYTYVYAPDGDKIRTIQFRGTGTLTPGSLSFGTKGQLLAAPGLFEFQVGP
ncbi:MAG TPA: hypothetical protein VM818_10015 [Vicinamibacterales bacterium]|nr:hypothetical protein [Vicinamibacterales bacterium]